MSNSSAPLPDRAARAHQAAIESWVQAAGPLLQAEVEKAVLQGLASAFRTLADRLPQLLAGAQAEEGPTLSLISPWTELSPVLPQPNGEPETATETEEQPALPAATLAGLEPVAPAAPVLAPRDGARLEYQRALQAGQGGSLEQAVVHLTKALRLEPSWAVLHVARADLLRRLGRTEESLADADRAIQLDPGLSAAYFVRAVACTRQGDNDQAIADLTYFLESCPDHALAHHARGLACANKGDYDHAIADYGRALRLRPALLMARYHRAVAYRLRGDHLFAVAELTKVLEARPDLAPAYLNRALAHLALEKPAQAVMDFDKAIELAPQDTDLRRRREEAVRAVAAARQAPPERPTPCADAARAPSPQPRPALAAPSPAIDPTCLPLSCPGCAAPARISWKRLDQLFRCRKCARVYRVSRQGTLTEVDLTQNQSGRFLHRKRALGAAAALLLFAVLTLGLLPRWHQKAASAELPSDLSSRGELWARAWLDGDRLLLRRLTAPAHDRQLHPWLLRHPSPLQPREKGSASSVDPEVQLRMLHPNPQQAILIVRLTGGPLKKPQELHLDWVEQGETWFFVPSLKR